MQFAELLSQHWCDLLFAQRNKEYGAYQLRRKAGLRYRRAVTIVLSIVLSIVLVPFVIKGLVLLEIIDAAQTMQSDRTIERLRPLQEHRLVEIAMGRRPRKATSSKAVTNNTEIVDMPQATDLTVALGPDITDEGNASSVDNAQSQPVLKDTLAPIQKDPIIPVKVVEEMPQYPGGPARLMQWLDQNIVYSQAMIERKESGIVTVAFIVKADGRIEDIRVLTKAHPLLVQAVVQAVHKMPAWTPGKRGGRNADVQVTIPIEFHAR